MNHPQGEASVFSTAVIRITWEEEGAENVGRNTYVAQNNTLIFQVDSEDPELFSLLIAYAEYNCKLLEFSFMFHSRFK